MTIRQKAHQTFEVASQRQEAERLQKIYDAATAREADAAQRALSALENLAELVQAEASCGRKTTTIYRVTYNEYPFEHRVIMKGYWAGFLDRRSYAEYEFTPPPFTASLYKLCADEGLNPEWRFTRGCSKADLQIPDALELVINW